MKTVYQYILLLCLIVCSLPLMAAQNNLHNLHIGVAGGMNHHLIPKDEPLTSKIGANGALALDYVLYHPLKNRNTHVGFKTGLLLGYRQAQYNGAFEQQFSHMDYLGNQMDYTTSGNVNIAQQQLYASLPLMFALRQQGLVWNIGVRLQANMHLQGTQQITSPLIRAYYPAYGVTITNELITGLPSDNQLSMPMAKTPMVIECLAATEIGYEFSINKKNAVGVMAYCHVGMWNSLSTASGQTIIQVAPITDSTNPVPAVTIGDAYSALLNTYMPLQVGVTLYYALHL